MWRAGSPFQMQAAETGKARSPTVQRRVGGMTSASDDDEQSRCLDSRSATSCNSSVGTMVAGHADDRRAWPACTQRAEVREANVTESISIFTDSILHIPPIQIDSFASSSAFSVNPSMQQSSYKQRITAQHHQISVHQNPIQTRIRQATMSLKVKWRSCNRSLVDITCIIYQSWLTIVWLYVRYEHIILYYRH